MLLHSDAKLPFPRGVVFETCRDKLLDLVAYLPDVRRIHIESRVEEANVIRFVNVWLGGGEIPKVARAFLSEATLSWTDRATWRNDEHVCEWRIETHAFTEALNCHGTNRYVEDGPDSMRLEIRAELTIDATKIRGVPRVLAPKLARTAEEFLASKIGPNLTEVGKGVHRYLDAQRAR